MDLVSTLRNYGVLLVCGLLVACLLTISYDQSKTFHEIKPVLMLNPVAEPSLPTPVSLKPLANKTPPKQLAKQLECMADNIYYEARGEGTLGMVAVARVVINRAEDPRWPDTPCGVVYDGAKYGKENAHLQRGKCQFSWLCQGTRPKKPDPVLYSQAWRVAYEVLVERKWDDRFAGLTFYHADYVKPKWPYRFVKKVGRHLFYKG